MRWVVGLLLLVSIGRALAQETPVVNDELKEQALAAYNQVITRFNTHIKKFSSWDAFKTEVFPMVSPDTVGNCYELTGDAMHPVEFTMVKFQRVEGGEWQKTSGKGWRQKKKDRTFIEYRFNQKADVLIRIEGVKPRFFFAHTKKICEFPL
jgi:hypothetical protein